MKDIITSLNTRYNAVIESNSDPLFYRNIHGYINSIVKTPVLAKIMDDSEQAYMEKHGEIVSVERDDDLQKERVLKLEQFSLYASDYCDLYTRIYEPLEKYRMTDELTGRENIMSNIMLNQVDTKRWTADYLKMFKKWYIGKRPEYENHIRQFHLDFITAIQSIEPEVQQKIEVVSVPKENLKPIIFVDHKKGIYQKFNEESAYHIRIPSGRFDVLIYLFTKDSCFVSELARISNQTDHVVMSAVIEVNRLFRKNTGHRYDLISHNDTIGYFLNREQFEVLEKH
jgi:hypothetical protein